MNFSNYSVMVVSVERTPPTPHHFSLGPLKDKKQYPFFFFKGSRARNYGFRNHDNVPLPRTQPPQVWKQKSSSQKAVFVFLFFPLKNYCPRPPSQVIKINLDARFVVVFCSLFLLLLLKDFCFFLFFKLKTKQKTAYFVLS